MVEIKAVVIFLRRLNIDIYATEIKKIVTKIITIFFADRDPVGIRTQDPNIKSVVLYQLSYEINLVFWECKNRRKHYCSKLLKLFFLQPLFQHTNDALF